MWYDNVLQNYETYVGSKSFRTVELQAITQAITVAWLFDVEVWMVTIYYKIFCTVLALLAALILATWVITTYQNA